MLPTHYPPLSPPSTPCMLGGCLEDRGAIRYQCSLPCFNTEQMNGPHAISLKEENSKAEWGWRRGGLCKVPSATASAPSYIRELIHVTGGFCHSAAWRHSASSLFHMMKCAYGRSGEGARRVRDGATLLVLALDPVRHLEGNRKPIHSTERLALSTDWQPDDLIAESQYYASAKWQRRRTGGSNTQSSEQRRESVLYISALWSNTPTRSTNISVSLPEIGCQESTLAFTMFPWFNVRHCRTENWWAWWGY